MEQLELRTPEENQIGSRSRLYALLSRGFRFPSAELYESVRGGNFVAEVQALAAALPYRLEVGELGRGAGLGYDDFQSQYIALFEVGGEYGPPSFLYEGEYGGGRMKVMEEVLRFYHFFGLRLSAEKRDRPDHLATELEFMHLLAFKEAEALVQGKKRDPYTKAERDFLKFHLCDFASAVAGRAGRSRAVFYSDLARLAEGFCQKELSYLESLGV